MKKEVKAHASATASVIYWTVILIGVGLLITAAHYTTQPFWFRKEREATVQSHQYVEARKSEIIRNIARYDELGVSIAKNKNNPQVVEALKMQRQSLVKKIRAALSKIPEDSWPSGARRFQ